ncbi:MAG: hypothetical protein K5931_07475, partial [Lachnospiraceae bacterium]|nr:hypothetical protein [Lachnospiraceae bacterium]
TDKDKYPNARQKYRFTLADGGYNKKDRKSQAGEKDKGEAAPKSAEEEKEIPYSKKYPAGDKDQESVSRYEYEEDDEAILQIKDELRDEEYEGAIDEDLEAFLDEKSYNKKIDHFMLLRKKMTPQILRTICFSLDFRPQGESLDEQCNDILEYLRTRRKYESDRLR